ncbi:MAG: hypothetical protein GY801_11025 [bacterium]|nr:hypothetical protein [bacterium]
MDRFISLIILYVVFSSISSFVKKLKKQQQQQQALLKKSGQVSKPQPKKDSTISFEEIFSVPQPKEPPPLLENALELVDDEIAFHAEDVPEEPVVELSSMLPPAVQRVQAKRSASLLSFNEKSYTQGIILSEILGPPVSQRKSR